MPGGEVEPDENFHEVLFREVKEEMGLRVRRVKDYLGSFGYGSESGERTRVFNYAVEVASSFEVQLSEHNEYIWVTKDISNQLSLTDPVSKILRAYWSR